MILYYPRMILKRLIFPMKFFENMKKKIENGKILLSLSEAMPEKKT